MVPLFRSVKVKMGVILLNRISNNLELLIPIPSQRKIERNDDDSFLENKYYGLMTVDEWIHQNCFIEWTIFTFSKTSKAYYCPHCDCKKEMTLKLQLNLSNFLPLVLCVVTWNDPSHSIKDQTFRRKRDDWNSKLFSRNRFRFDGISFRCICLTLFRLKTPHIF